MSTERIIELLAESDIVAEHRPTSSPDDLPEVLRDPGDLVVAAGGDGTIRAVALALAAQPGTKVPLALAPLGTANNIARTLGLKERTEQLLRGLGEPELRPFDMGLIRAPWGESRFLEAFGFGFFAYGMVNYAPEQGKSLLRALRATLATLTQYEAKDWQLTLDGKDISGRYTMVEVMNTAAMGLRLRLAPGADPSDGLFDVVCVREDKSVGIESYIIKLTVGHLDKLENVDIFRGKDLRLEWDGSPLHFDEEVRGDDEVQGAAGSIEVRLQPGALTLWLPQAYVG